MYLEIKDLAPVECYQALVAAVIPRPIAWVSTISKEGVDNLAPYSFFTVVSCQPMVLCVTEIFPRDMQHKHTLTNLQQTGECVVNIVDSAAAELMNATSASYAVDQDEFAELGIEKVASIRVKAAGVAISPVRFECQLREIICISDQPMGGSMMLLNVVALHAEDRCVIGDKIDTLKVGAIGKMGGNFYSSTDTSFELVRP